MKKRILISKGGSVFLVCLGIVAALFFYCISRTEYSTFKDAFRDPRVIIMVVFSLFPFFCACIHYVITDEGIKIPFKKIIKYEDITEVGVNYGGKYEKNLPPKIAYIKHITDNSDEKYTFIDDSPKELYAYLSKNYKLNYVENTIDRKRRNELRQYGKLMQIFESVCCGTLVLFFVAVGLILLARILQQKSFSLIGILSLIFMGLMVKSLSGIWFSLGVKVRFDTEHLYVKFPLHKEIVYGWDEFRHVCICYTYLTSVRGGPYKIVICFVKHGVKKTIISKQWPVENGFQYKNVPYVRYSDAVLEELKKYCPHEIVDLRGTNGYYH